MFTRILVDGIFPVFLFLIFSPSEIKGVVVTQIRILEFRLSLDGEVPCVAAYASIRRSGVPVNWESRFGRLISLLRVPFSLGVFYMTTYLLCCFACPELHFLFPLLLCFVVVEDLQHLFLECLFVQVCGMWCPLLLDIIST